MGTSTRADMITTNQYNCFRHNALRCIGAFGVATLTAACGAGDLAVDARWAGTRDTVSGVEVVRNPATPLLAAGDVAVSMRWTTPDPSAVPTADRPLWEQPVDIEVGGGVVYVLDRMARHVYALRAADGRWQATIGRPGGGPGEFERPQDLAVLGDTLVVLDGGKASVEFFGPDGRYRRSVHLNGVGFGILALAPDRLLVNMLQGSTGGWWIFDRDGGRAQASFPAPVARHPEDPPDCGRTTTAGPHILRTSCTTLHFQRLDGNGVPVREVVVDGAPVRPSEAAIEAVLDRRRSTMERDGIPRALAESVLERQREGLRLSLRMRAVRQDPDTHRYALWEQTAEELGGGNAMLHLFSAGGIYLAELRFDREWVDYDVAGGTVFALVRDPETDLVRLVAYRIALSGIDAPFGGRPAPDGGAAPVEAPPAQRERPDTLHGTILLEGMADSMTFVLYETPAAFPVPFSTYIPEDMAVEALGSGAGDAFRFVAEFGGVRNEDAFVEAFFFPAGTTEAEARERTRMFAERRGIRERDPELGKRFPWSVAEYDFRQPRPDAGAIAGGVALGRHGDRFFRIALHYPEAYGDGFGPRAQRILEAWRWTEDGGARALVHEPS